MPATTIFGTFTTNPLAGDDFQIVCIVLGAFRLIQLLCVVPLVLVLLVDQFNGNDLIINGYRNWCPQWHDAFDYREDFLVLTVGEAQQGENQITRQHTFGRFIVLSCVYTGLDFAWILAVWGSATVGTPTQPKGRDRYLRSLIVLKLFLNFLPIAIVVFGCFGIHRARMDNYGCGDEIPVYVPDQSWDYVLMCILMVTYAMEIFVWPAMAANKAMRWLRSNKFTQKKRYIAQAKGERFEQCLGGLLQCISVLCCNKMGGKEIKNQGEISDFASNLMEFANNDTKVGIVLSDMYVGGKLLARVQAERRMNAIQMLQQASNKKDREPEVTRSSDAPTDRRVLMDTKDVKRRRSILTLQTDEDGKGCVVVEKNVLTSSNSEDCIALRNAAHYSLYAQYVYHHVRMVLDMGDNLAKDETSFVRDFRVTEPMQNLALSFASFGVSHVHIVYANFYNGIAATPYAILVDEEEKSVVITVRGTISLEDWVMDLQYVPQPLKKVGNLCGFDGEGHHCHKGVLTRCKWLYNDIKKQGVLRRMYSSDSNFKYYDLVVVGHSLGGGCAQVLSLMLRPSFPSLRCFAYEPPGCIFDDKLSEDCKEWITSVVRHDDVVPRVTQPNLESLRDEFFDIVARIKCSKAKAFRDLRTPCPEPHLASRNAGILCPKSHIDKDTQFYRQVMLFRNERARKNLSGEVSIKLYIPGRIIHLVDTLGDETKYVPYWASRYEFNQVVLSGRMLADHSVPPLVDILRNLNLDDVHEVRTWHVDEDNHVNDEELEDIPTMVPFSNPQGKMPLAIIAFGLTAVIIGAVSNRSCKYVARTATIMEVNGTSRRGLGLSAGLWNYNLRQCIDVENCDTNDPDDLVDSRYCQQYGKLFDTVDGYWTAARAFGTVSVVLGALVLGLISIATCTKLKKRTWAMLTLTLLIVTLFQGLQLLILKSDLCNVWTNPETLETVESDCMLSFAGNIGIASCVFWFLTAVGCSYMAKMK